MSFYAIPDSAARRLLRVARGLRAEHKENPEYNRALVELISNALPTSMVIAEDLILRDGSSSYDYTKDIVPVPTDTSLVRLLTDPNGEPSLNQMAIARYFFRLGAMVQLRAALGARDKDEVPDMPELEVLAHHLARLTLTDERSDG